MIPQLLVGVSALVIGLLGGAHLLFTFSGAKLTPRDASVRAAMEGGSPMITREITVWSAWVGFNASHSMGALLYAAVYGYFALAQPDLLFGSAYLLSLGAITLAGYLFLGLRYWFSTPRNGIIIAFACYVTAVIVRAAM